MMDEATSIESYIKVTPKVQQKKGSHRSYLLHCINHLMDNIPSRVEVEPQGNKPKYLECVVLTIKIKQYIYSD